MSLAARQVLALSTLSDASHLRRYLLGGQQEVPAFLGNLICLLLADPDHGVQSQVADVLQLVMDPSQVAPKSRAAFLDALYSHGVLDLIAKPLMDLTDLEAEADTSRLSSSGCFAIQTICELLAFAVASHGQRPEALIKKNSLAQKALVVAAASGQKYLQLAPIRLVKAMTKAEDHMYLFHMLDTGIFGLILKILEQSCQPPSMGGGLLAAAVSELLEVIRLQNAKPLVWHICTEYEGILRSLAPRLKVAEALLARHEKNREEEAERRHKAKASNALRRMARGHHLDETEQGATVPKTCAEVQDAPTVEEVEDDSVAGKSFAEIFGADADDADSDFSDSDEEEEEEAAEDASDSVSTSSESSEEGLFRGLTPQALMMHIRNAAKEEDEDTVRKALRVLWREGAHPDAKDAEFLSQLRDWLGEDEALNALILQNGLQREMAMEEVLGPQDDDSPPDHPEPATSGTALEGEVKMAQEAMDPMCWGLDFLTSKPNLSNSLATLGARGTATVAMCSDSDAPRAARDVLARAGITKKPKSSDKATPAATPAGPLLVMRSYYFEEKPTEDPPREVNSKPVPQYLGLNLEEHRDFFHEAACTLDDLLTTNFGVHLPPQDLMWPVEPLHMTTFFLGGAKADSAVPLLSEAPEGSIWELQTAHLIYLEGALLMMSLRVPDTLPLDVGCLPHATLLCGPGFAPRDANEVLARATDLGWLDDVAQLSTGRLDVLGSVRNLYIQPFPDVVLPARLEAFWPQPKKMLGWVATGRAALKTQSRRGAHHWAAISRLQAERCRNFIASQPKVDASGDRSGRRNSKLPEGKVLQKEEPPGRRSLSHASKRARKETPAIPA
eukprot:s1778_g6.t2